jgi:glycosyltransferase involved in cell wall biosynthesis
MTARSFAIPIWSKRRTADRHWDPPFSAADPGDVIGGMFSIIIPVYNGGESLERCIDSVQDQTYQDFEIIVVDDGSTDDSLETALRLASDDSRIKVQAIDNSGGPARPRNHAIQLSRGEFIAFLDQDDWWFPEKLERQLARFQEDHFAVVYSDAIYLDPLSPHSGSLITELPAHSERFGNVPGRLPEGQVQPYLIVGNFAGMVTVVIRRDWVRKVGKLDESAVGVDCYEYLLRIALAGGSFGAVREPLAVHDRGTLSRDQEQASAQSLRFFKDFSRRYPQYREEWMFHVRGYENVLIEDRLQRIREGSRPLPKRLRAFYDLLWLHCGRRDLARAAKSLLPPTLRRGLRVAARPVRTLVGR